MNNPKFNDYIDVIYPKSFWTTDARICQFWDYIHGLLNLVCLPGLVVTALYQTYFIIVTLLSCGISIICSMYCGVHVYDCQLFSALLLLSCGFSDISLHNVLHTPVGVCSATLL